MFKRKRCERIIIDGELTVWPTEMGCGWVRLEVDSAWPESMVGKVCLPMYPGETPLFDPMYARPAGAVRSACERPGFDLEVGDTLLFSCNVFVHVVEANRGSARFGIHAPLEIPVHRWEVFLSIINEGRSPPASS